MQAPYTNKPIDEDKDEDDIDDAYDEATRMETQLQRAPLQRYVVRNLNFNTTARRRDHTDVGFTPNVLPSRPKRQQRPRYPYTLGS